MLDVDYRAWAVNASVVSPINSDYVYLGLHMALAQRVHTPNIRIIFIQIQTIR